MNRMNPPPTQNGGSLQRLSFAIALVLGVMTCSGCAAAKYHAKRISPFHDTAIEKAEKKVKNTGKKLDDTFGGKETSSEGEQGTPK